MKKEKQNRINFGVLYFTEPDETGHQFGPYSENLKAILNKIDLIVGYLIEKLINNNLFDQMSKKPFLFNILKWCKFKCFFQKLDIIITSDHGMDEASFKNSIDLSDYVDISKFKSYGGLTQINIFPNDSKNIFRN